MRRWVITNMKTIYSTIKDKLEADSDFRERRWRDKYLVDLILEKHGKYGMFVDINFLPDFAKDYTSYERIWRQVLAENEDLRGDDYGDKEVLEQKEMLKLGYESGYNQKLKI